MEAFHRLGGITGDSYHVRSITIAMESMMAMGLIADNKSFFIKYTFSLTNGTLPIFTAQKKKGVDIH